MFLSLLDLLRQQGGATFSEPAPAMSLEDQSGALMLRAALRGYDPKSVQVQLTESSVAISGRRTVEERTEGPQSYRYEMAVSRFYRELPLPCRINPRGAAARWEVEDMLVLHLPKA